MVTVKEGLQQVPTILAKRGWIKHMMMNHAGEVCLVGACRVAFTGYAFEMEGSPELIRAEDLLEECIKEKAGMALAITMFNDSSATTLDDVLEVVECAIKKAD